MVANKSSIRTSSLSSSSSSSSISSPRIKDLTAEVVPPPRMLELTASEAGEDSEGDYINHEKHVFIQVAPLKVTEKINEVLGKTNKRQQELDALAKDVEKKRKAVSRTGLMMEKSIHAVAEEVSIAMRALVSMPGGGL